MENRRSIYYAGNTVAAPRPSRKNLKRRFAGNPLKRELMNDTVEVKMNTVEEKVCATTQCVWCEVPFDKPSIRCRVCGNCQYCGRFCQFSSGCTSCGNKLPPELQSNEPHRVVRIE